MTKEQAQHDMEQLTEHLGRLSNQRESAIAQYDREIQETKDRILELFFMHKQDINNGTNDNTDN